MQLYWLWLAMMPELTRRQKLKLLAHFSDPEAIYQCVDFTGVADLTQRHIALLQNKDLTDATRLRNLCQRKDIGILTIQDQAYPARLRNIADPPILLYYKGVLPSFERMPAIGVVGTRKATAYGMNTARKFGAQLSAGGGIVVSGGAAGVDTMALQGALDADGTTVAVLGCGVDVVYPTTNRRLFSLIQDKGCLLSEYIPGTQPKPWNFPERNRIISGLSNGVLVIEAPEKSGALITARDALEQGRDVFAVPANIDMPTCVGSNGLLSEGAGAVVSGWDILREYAYQYPDAVVFGAPEIKQDQMKAAQPVQVPAADKKDIDIPVNNSYSVTDNTDPSLTEQESCVLSCLDRRPQAMDEVIARSGLPTGEVKTALTKLSLKGMVVNHPGGLVSARKQ